MLYLLTLALATVFAASSIDDESVSGKLDHYLDDCSGAVLNDREFATFKSSYWYSHVLEHVTFDLGEQYAQILKESYPHLVKQAGVFKVNDQIGVPTRYFFKGLGLFSPTTLRYMKIAGDIQRLFGNLDGKKFIEIGGGYGGQCLVLSKLNEFSEYLQIDLHWPVRLQEKYLRAANVPNVRCLAARNVQTAEESDLVISNFAFSECSRTIQDLYYETYMRHSERGYFIVNAPTINRYENRKIQERLENDGFDTFVFEETPNSDSWNALLVWVKKGVDAPVRSLEKDAVFIRHILPEERVLP